MTARELFSCITKHCEEIYRKLQFLTDTRTAYEQHLTRLCDQAMQAYFWEDQETLNTLLRETQALAVRLQMAVAQGGSYPLVA